MSQKRMLKEDYINIITEHFSKQNKKLTNLARANITELKNIIKKTDIKFNQAEYLKGKNIEIKEKKEQESKEKENKEEERKLYNLDKQNQKLFWEELDEVKKNKLINWFVLSNQITFIKNYFINMEHNKNIIMQVDKLEMDLNNKSGYVERVNGNTLDYGGIKRVFGCLYETEFNVVKETNDIKIRFEDGDMNTIKIYEYLEKYNWKVTENFDMVIEEVEK